MERYTTHMARTASQDLSEALLDAAEQILTEQGAPALTVRKVATAAGVAPMGVYNRFDGKQGLLEALFIKGFNLLRDYMNEADGPDARARLRSSSQKYRAFALTHPEHYRLMFEHMHEVQPSEAALNTAYASFDQLVALVSDVRSQGPFGLGTATDVAQQWWNAIHGAVSLELVGMPFVEDADATFVRMIDAMLAGQSQVADVDALGP